MSKRFVLPPLPPPARAPKRKTAALRVKQEPPPRPARKFRDPAAVALARQQFDKWREENAVEKSEMDKKIEASAAKIAAMREDQEEQEKKSGALTLDEQVLILQSHFEHGIGVKVLARQLGRNHSVVSRFLAKYKSTGILAKMHLHNQAERLARRVVKGANVEESLEVLDRLDVLPKKERAKSGAENNTTFQVMVAMPAHQQQVKLVPSQAAVEAAALAPKATDGDSD